MIKRGNIANLEKFSNQNIFKISYVLKVVDYATGTIYYSEFYYAYVSKQIITMEKISERLNISNNTLKQHIKKINSIINAVETITDDDFIKI